MTRRTERAPYEARWRQLARLSGIVTYHPATCSRRTATGSARCQTRRNSLTGGWWTPPGWRSFPAPARSHDNLDDGYRLASLIDVAVTSLDRHQLTRLDAGCPRPGAGQAASPLGTSVLDLEPALAAVPWLASEELSGSPKTAAVLAGLASQVTGLFSQFTVKGICMGYVVVPESVALG